VGSEGWIKIRDEAAGSGDEAVSDTFSLHNNKLDEIKMSEELSERQRQLKEQFTRERGYWFEEVWGDILRMDTDFFEAYLNFSAVPWRKGVLPPKIKELIYVAIDASTTHLFAPGLRLHIRNALRYGATKEEIMEVLELTSVLGIHTCAVGVPILLEELRAQKQQ
jgi:alkylhydroperoxidase/carboxymuconolactone decarboxylase family protein YurZ